MGDGCPSQLDLLLRPRLELMCDFKSVHTFCFVLNDAACPKASKRWSTRRSLSC